MTNSGAPMMVLCRNKIWRSWSHHLWETWTTITPPWNLDRKIC